MSIRDLSRQIAQDFRLTAKELKQPLPSGRAPQFYNRLQWAVFHLRKAGLALVDGQELAGLMIDHGIGVTTVATYAVRRIDSDYFDEQEEGLTSS